MASLENDEDWTRWIDFFSQPSSPSLCAESVAGDNRQATPGEPSKHDEMIVNCSSPLPSTLPINHRNSSDETHSQNISPVAGPAGSQDPDDGRLTGVSRCSLRTGSPSSRDAASQATASRPSGLLAVHVEPSLLKRHILLDEHGPGRGPRDDLRILAGSCQKELTAGDKNIDPRLLPGSGAPVSNQLLERCFLDCLARFEHSPRICRRYKVLSIPSVAKKSSPFQATTDIGFNQQAPSPSIIESTSLQRRLVHSQTPDFSKDDSEGRRRGAPDGSSPSCTPLFARATALIDSAQPTSQSFTGAKNCLIQDDLLFKTLIKLVDYWIKDGVDDSIYIRLRNVIMQFYKEHACGYYDDSLETLLLKQISAPAVKSGTSVVFVDAADRMFYNAGWRLKATPFPRIDALDSRIPAPEVESSPSQPRPNPRRTAAKAGKRKQLSPSPQTSGSKKRQSTGQSTVGSVSDTRTSVSRSSAVEVTCDVCNKSMATSRWREHYETHFPSKFWVCFLGCDYLSYRKDAMIQHLDGNKHPPHNLQLSELQDRLAQSNYVIRDLGHDCCVYCKLDFEAEDDTKLRTEHIFAHVRRQHKVTGHRCLSLIPRRCDLKWKQSRDVYPENQRERVPVTVAGSQRRGRGHTGTPLMTNGVEGATAQKQMHGGNSQRPGVMAMYRPAQASVNPLMGYMGPMDESWNPNFPRSESRPEAMADHLARIAASLQDLDG